MVTDMTKSLWFFLPSNITGKYSFCILYLLSSLLQLVLLVTHYSLVHALFGRDAEITLVETGLLEKDSLSRATLNH